MPKKSLYTEEQVVALYKETGVVNEVARRLGAGSDNIRKILRRHKGKCQSCTNDILPGRGHCVECLKKRRAHKKEDRARRRRLGICMQCDRPIEPPSRMHCAEHRIKHLEASVAYNERKRQKRGHWQAGVSSQSAHDRYLRYKHGPDAVIAWHRDEGRCVICGVAHADVSVCIHHIDRNDQNATVENMVCLCFRCHKLTHLLIEHPEPMKMLDWLRTTYPDTVS